MLFCPAFVGSGPQRIMKRLPVQCVPVELIQNINVIEISHAGVGGGSGDDCFQLFSQEICSFDNRQGGFSKRFTVICSACFSGDKEAQDLQMCAA